MHSIASAVKNTVHDVADRIEENQHALEGQATAMADGWMGKLGLSRDMEFEGHPVATAAAQDIVGMVAVVFGTLAITILILAVIYDAATETDAFNDTPLEGSLDSLFEWVDPTVMLIVLVVISAAAGLALRHLRSL